MIQRDTLTRIYPSIFVCVSLCVCFIEHLATKLRATVRLSRRTAVANMQALVKLIICNNLGGVAGLKSRSWSNPIPPEYATVHLARSAAAAAAGAVAMRCQETAAVWCRRERRSADDRRRRPLLSHSDVVKIASRRCCRRPSYDFST